ncbi:hypothetical protein ACE14D_07925 [Streptomyces sp. Act-28]
MFDFGIEGYRPEWLDRPGDLPRRHGDRLRGLAGRRLTGAWLVWDPVDDVWFPDCPVLFDFEGEQLEVNHRKLDDLSLTWNTVDPSAPVRWPGFELRWRAEPLPELRALRGLPLERVELLQWTGRDAARGTVEIGLGFGTDRVTVFNALDENGLDFGPPDPGTRRLLPY